MGRWWIAYLSGGPEYDLIIIGAGKLGLRESLVLGNILAVATDDGRRAGMVMVDSFRPDLLYLRTSHLSKRARYARVLNQSVSIRHDAQQE